MRRYAKEDYQFLSPASEVVADAKAGKMFILIDSEDRENEGDLVIPASKATPEVINFMATHGRGLICLALTAERAAGLHLELMPSSKRQSGRTAFTISIEAREGVTTGISAHDRAHTIATAIDPSKGAEDIVTPGHVFPLIARDGGVLVRAGHTEAAVDIARLAGLPPAGVICEIMKEDGTMARLPDLIPFAQRHGFKMATIASLIAWRRERDHIIRRADQSELDSEYGGKFKLMLYESKIDNSRHAALIKGDISGDAPVLTRVHVANVREDMLAQRGGRADMLRRSMELIAKEGRGVLLLLDPASQPVMEQALASTRPASDGDSRGERLVEHGVGAQILLDLGIRDMILLTDTKLNIVGLEGYGLNITERRPILTAKE